MLEDFLFYYEGTKGEVNRVFLVYYEGINREVNRILMYECGCDERLKAFIEGLVSHVHQKEEGM